jgi:hypothetical protein
MWSGRQQGGWFPYVDSRWPTLLFASIFSLEASMTVRSPSDFLFHFRAFCSSTIGLQAYP